jgi:pilus assembly protein CpaB
LGVGLIALKVFVNVLHKAKAAPSETLPVVFAAANIEPTLEIQETMLELRNVPKDLVPETGFREKGEVAGRVASWPIPKGSAIGAMQLAAKGTPPGMAVRIADGYRAVAVKIDESAGVAGWIKPGSRVDVVALLSSPNRGNESFSKVILQNVEVLAVGQDIGKAGETAAELTKSVTLLVAPEDVPKLHLAETKGKLRLAMRNQHDATTGKDCTTTDNDLLALGSTGHPTSRPTTSSLLSGILNAQAKIGLEQTDKDNQSEAASARRAPASQPWTVELYKGPQDVETIKFEGKAPQWRRVDDSQARAGRAPTFSPDKPAPQVRLLPPKSAQAAAGDIPSAKTSSVLEGPARTQ